MYQTTWRKLNPVYKIPIEIVKYKKGLTQTEKDQLFIAVGVFILFTIYLIIWN